MYNTSSSVGCFFNAYTNFDWLKATNLFFEGKNSFVSLPTGYGKSIILQAIPVIVSALWKKACAIIIIIVFIVLHLKALMEDQVSYLNGAGLKAMA